MKVKVRFVATWTENITRRDAGEITGFSYAPNFPPKHLWPKLLKEWYQNCPLTPDNAKIKITVQHERRRTTS